MLIYANSVDMYYENPNILVGLRFKYLFYFFIELNDCSRFTNISNKKHIIKLAESQEINLHLSLLIIAKAMINKTCKMN